MHKNKISMAVAALGLALGIAATGTLHADTFGTSGNEFTIDFVNIGDAGNTADILTGYGAVSYNYRIGTYEISQDAIDKATASGMTNVTAGAWSYAGENKPAANITWFEAAAFANWLNTSTGHQAAYNLSWNTGNGTWSMSVWSSEQAWQTGGENLYRNKDAYYFLPSENEWYKAAYYNAAGSNYYRYATESGVEPFEVEYGTDPDSAVYGTPYGNDPILEPADVNNAGGLSPYGTMAQNGNVWEWTESDATPPNDNPTANRALRGGYFGEATSINMESIERATSISDPSRPDVNWGFRIASAEAVPEPASGMLMLVAGGAYWLARRRSGKR